MLLSLGWGGERDRRREVSCTSWASSAVGAGQPAWLQPAAGLHAEPPTAADRRPPTSCVLGFHLQCSIDHCTAFATNMCTCTACDAGFKLNASSCVVVSAVASLGVAGHGQRVHGCGSGSCGKRPPVFALAEIYDLPSITSASRQLLLLS